MRVERRPNIPIARALRRERATEVEKRLWLELRDRRLCGAKFRRQYTLGRYILDFVCLERQLVIELDGGQHGEPVGAAADEERTNWLKAQGFRVLRYWNNDVTENLAGVLANIAEALNQPPSPQPPLPPAGEGLQTEQDDAR